MKYCNRLNNFIKGFILNIYKLNISQLTQLEGPLTYEECLTSLKNMSNNKSQENFGLTGEFYKVFWINIGHFLARSIDQGFDKGELSITQKQGVITGIPKVDKIKRNYRKIGDPYCF